MHSVIEKTPLLWLQANDRLTVGGAVLRAMTEPPSQDAPNSVLAFWWLLVLLDWSAAVEPSTIAPQSAPPSSPATQSHSQPFEPLAMASRGEVLPAEGGFKVRRPCSGPPPLAPRHRFPATAFATAPPPCQGFMGAATLPVHLVTPQAVFHAGDQQHTVAPLPSAEAAALVLDALEGEGRGAASALQLSAFSGK